MSNKSKDAENTIIPSWINPMLNTKYFGNCVIHGESTKAECNLFCLICKGNSMCSCCAVEHKNHPIVQIRRSSYNDVILLSEISNHIDASNIQTYRINNARVIFLNHRPIVRPGKGFSFACEICGRSLIDPFKFCSLGCKVEGVNKREPGVTFELVNELPKQIELANELNEPFRKKILSRWISEQSSSDNETLNSGDKISNSNLPATDASAISHRTHRRKGIPRRAPFF